MAAAPPIFIAVARERCGCGVSAACEGVAEVDDVAPSLCAAGASVAVGRRRGRMTVTSDDSNALTGVGECDGVSRAFGCDDGWVGCCDGWVGCCAPQKAQYLAMAAIELPQFRQSGTPTSRMVVGAK